MGPVLGPGDAGFVSPEDYQAIVDEYNLAGHPVDEFSGAVVDRTVDLALFGLIPVELTRVYNSHFSSVRTQLGVGGWAFGLAQWIEEDAKGPKLRDADGRFVRFDRLEPGERGFRRARRYDIARTTSGTYTVYSIDTRLEREFAFSRPHADAATERRFCAPFVTAMLRLRRPTPNGEDDAEERRQSEGFSGNARYVIRVTPEQAAAAQQLQRDALAHGGSGGLYLPTSGTSSGIAMDSQRSV